VKRASVYALCALACLSGAGCEGPTLDLGATDTDAGRDASVRHDAGHDAGTHDASPGCRDDDACRAASPLRPLCHVDAGICVQCLSSADCTSAAAPRCEVGEWHCDN
jgi:hypothetical protein